MQESPNVEILEQGQQLALTWPDSSRGRFHAIWLRDNGQDPNTRDPGNNQKLVTLADIPAETRIEKATISGSMLSLEFAPDRWQTQIDWGWLQGHCYDRTAGASDSLVSAEFTTWDRGFSENIPLARFDDVSADPEKLLHWLGGVSRYGIAILDGLPSRNAAVLEVIALFGYPRETNYGSFFEIRSEIDPINLAYTNKGLQSHTDNPYRDPVPGLQLFGCLENSAEGGDSVVVDGFRIAERLREESSEQFELLRKFNADFTYDGSRDVHLKTSLPIIQCDREGALQCVRFNNRSCSALVNVPFEEMEAYYAAYRRFGELVDAREMEVRFKLEPNQLFITDNMRVLHGRTGFSGSGNRWMQGAYADKDSLASKIRVLEAELGL